MYKNDIIFLGTPRGVRNVFSAKRFFACCITKLGWLVRLFVFLGVFMLTF